MSFGERLRTRREEMKISRTDLAETLGVSRSSISNYENGFSFPKEDIMLKLFDCLQVDPNYLYRDSFHGEAQVLSHNERILLEKYRTLTQTGRSAVRSVTDALSAYQEEMQQTTGGERRIPCYHTPAALGYPAPVCGADFDLIPAAEEPAASAAFAFRMRGGEMEPALSDGATAYVNHEPLEDGEIGLFCGGGTILCRQYHRDSDGTTHLYVLNREMRKYDRVFSADSPHPLVCMGHLLLPSRPLPEES
jgi:repressor LexA